jgi:hypothetical protein
MSTEITTSNAASEWDEIRAMFASSLMADTALSSLAQNLDGVDWPLHGADETPAAYLDFTYNELAALFARRGQPDAAAQLVRILRETLAFDQPFGEMVKQTAAAESRENPLLRTLARLGISEEYPVGLTALDDTARELCRLEQVRTLGQFALFAQGLSQNVIVGGDLRRLLNALAHVDEKALAEFLPFRPGTSGLHLAEAMAQAANSSDPQERSARAAVWFATELADWRREATTDRRILARRLAVLNNPVLEQRVGRLLAPYLDLDESEPQPGLWATLRRWLKL